MENQKLQDLEKIFKAGGDAVCLPNTKTQTLTEFLDKNEDLALRLGAVIQSLPQDNFCKVCNLSTDGEKCYSKRCPI